MNEHYSKTIEIKSKKLFHKDGKTYFSKETERKICFVLTMAMLTFGILTKAGLF